MNGKYECPKCKAAFRLKTVYRGKPVECPKCERMVTLRPRADDDEAADNDEPAPKRKTKRAGAKPRSGSLIPLLLVGGGVGTIALFVVVVGALALIYWRPQSLEPAPVPVAQVKDPTKEPPQESDKKDVRVELTKPVAKDKDEKPNGNAGKLSSEKRARIADATVLINVGLQEGQAGSGSGFFVEEPGVICTNAHVVGMLNNGSPPPKQIQVVVRSGEKGERILDGKVIAIDRAADLALVKVAVDGDSLPTPLSLKKVPAVQQTDRVYVFGYPFGERLGKQTTISESSISSLRSKTGQLDQLQLNGGIHPGNSGGPIVDADGALIGISVAIISGTQINFAVPAQKALEMLQGNVTGVQVEESTQLGKRVRVPVRLDISDPLGRVSQVRMNWWIGAPGPHRPGGDAKAEMQAGDSSPRLAICPYAADKGQARANLLLDEVPASGKVLWCQAMIKTRDGSMRYTVATPLRVLAPLTPRDTTLVRKTQPGMQSVGLKISHVTKILRGAGAGRITQVDSEIAMVEDTRQPDATGKFRFQIKTASLRIGENGQEPRSHAGLEPTLEQAFRAFIDARADEQGNFVELKPDVSTVVTKRDNMAKFLEHVVRGLELTAVPIAETSLKPGHSWRGARQPTMAALATPIPHLFDLVYTYRGMRVHERRDVAVISVEGSLRKNFDQDSGQNFDGNLTAEALIDSATGQVLRFDGAYHINHKMRFNTANVQDLEESVTLSLTRGAQPTVDLAGFTGAWCIVKQVNNGVELPLSTEHEVWWIIDANQAVQVENPRTSNDFLPRPYKLRPDIDAGAIDMRDRIILQTTRPLNPARFEINGKTLKICISTDNSERPSDVSSPPNSRRLLIILERVDGWKPGFTRPPIHIAKAPPVDPKFKDNPDTLLTVDRLATPDSSSVDLSSGIELGYTIRVSDRIKQVVLSGNGKTIACAIDQEILCIDVASRKTLSTLKAEKEGMLLLTHDGSKLAIIRDQKISLHDVSTLKEIKSIDTPPFKGLIVPMFSPGGRYLGLLHRGSSLQILDTQTGKVVRNIQTKAMLATISQDGQFLLLNEGKDISLYEFASFKPIRTYKCPFGGFSSGAMSPDSKLVYGVWAGRFASFDRVTGNKVLEYAPKQRVQRLWISSDHAFVIAGQGGQGPCEFFRVGNPQPLASSNVYLGGLLANFTCGYPGRIIDAHEKELKLYCAKTDPAFVGTAVAKEKDPNSEIDKIPAVQAAVKYTLKLRGPPIRYFGAVTFSQDGKYIVAGGADKNIHVFDAATGKPIKSLPGGFDFISALAMSADETIYIGGGGKLKLGEVPETHIARVSLATGKEERVTGVSGAYTNLYLSPNGERLYGISTDYSFRVWEAKTGKQLHAWESLLRRPSSLEMSPDGKTGLLVMDNGPIVFNLETNREGLKLPADRTFQMALLGEGSRAACIFKETTLKIFDLKSGNVSKSIELAERNSPKVYGIGGSSTDGKHVYLSGQLPEGDLYHVVEIETGKIVARYRLPGPPAQRPAARGNLFVFRTIDEIRVVELPPLSK